MAGAGDSAKRLNRVPYKADDKTALKRAVSLLSGGD
ncbi:hypothetical protein M2387_002427 [Klebsiella sp. BIGb0407]|nr:hypothetical protein [Klebsiella sp. BIGb0407]